MDKHQKDFLAKKVEELNPDWLKTGKVITTLDKINRTMERMPTLLRYVLIALIIANLGIYLRWLIEIIS